MKKITEISIVALLLTIFILLASLSMVNNSATFDEPNIITAGYSYWKTGDYRLTFEHPPLAKLIAGFPLLFMNQQPVLPLESEEWKAAETPEGAFVQQWPFSQNFFFKMNNDAEKMLLYARIPFLLIGILLGISIYSFAKKLLLKQQISENHAIYGAFFALFLYTCSPLMLAYTTLAITDMAITTFFFMTIYSAWQWAETQKTKDLVLCSIFFGLANATKFTGLYLIPVLFILFFANSFLKKEKVFVAAKAISIILVIGVIIVTATYGFTNSASYIDGFNFVREHSTVGHNAYLFGEYSAEGWWYYFIVAFFVKTPVPLIILLILALFFVSKEKKFLAPEVLFLLTPAVLYFIAFMLNNINIGIRHILPIYPFIFVFTATEITVQFVKAGFSTGVFTSGFADNFCSQWKITRKLEDRPERSEHTIRSLTGGGRSSVDNKSKILLAITTIFVVWSTLTLLLVTPHYLAYFNEFAGGSGNGAKILLDSNIDWSQDLERLEKWLDKNKLKQDPQYYAVFSVEPLVYRNMTAKSMPCSQHLGLFIISANELYDIGQRYQGCLDWLQKETPSEKIGYSIFIYNITEKTHPEIAAIGNQCTAACKTTCAEINQMYVDYIYADHCVCACEE